MAVLNAYQKRQRARQYDRYRDLLNECSLLKRHNEILTLELRLRREEVREFRRALKLLEKRK